MLETTLPRRRWFGITFGVAATLALPAFAASRKPLARMTEGPFYPPAAWRQRWSDWDADLTRVHDIGMARGEHLGLEGRVVDTDGRAIDGATVEIWQCDAKAVYLHTRDSAPKAAQQDKNFQGFGRFVTSSTGEYYFRTIKPVAYPGRTPHIHFAVKVKGQSKFTTQCYIKGHPGNEKDGIWRRLDEKGRAAVTVDFTPIKESKIGELSAKFDLVLGVTPEG